MSDPRYTANDDITARLKDIVKPTDGEIDVETVVARVRASIGQTASEVDTEAVVSRVKGAFQSVEGSVDAQKFRDWIGGIDKETVKSWMDDPKGTASSAAAFVSAQGERLSDRAPGVFDRLLGTVKETIGDVTGNQDLAREGELQHLKGDIEKRLAGSAEAAEGEFDAAAEAAKKRLDHIER